MKTHGELSIKCEVGLHTLKYFSLPYLLQVCRQTGLSKQFRPRPDATECGIWPGSTLFATYPAVVFVVVFFFLLVFLFNMPLGSKYVLVHILTQKYVKELGRLNN